MRASAVRTAIIATVTAIAPDTSAAEGDRFVHMATHARDPDAAPSRAFRIELVTQPQRADLTTDDAWIVEHRLTIYQPHSPDIEDRIALDAELVDIALERLHEDYADVNNCTCEPAGVDELAQLVASRFSVVTLYRQDSSIL